MNNIHLSIRKFGAAFGAGAAKLTELAASIEGGWFSCETFTALHFDKYTGGDVPDFASSFSGRIFNKTKEVRWIRCDGRWVFSVLYEVESGEDPLYETRDLRFYLWGEYDASSGDFWETRIPGRHRYPVDTVMLKDHDRAYVCVREYLLVTPPSDLKDMDEMVDFLNQPFVVQHRFVGVGAGRDGDKGSDAEQAECLLHRENNNA